MLVDAASASRGFSPAYLSLFESGELKRRVDRAVKTLCCCTGCPRDCRVDRLQNKFAVCRTGRYAVVASHSPHHGEEDCLRKVELIVLPTAQAIEMLNNDNDDTNAVLHVTC